MTATAVRAADPAALRRLDQRVLQVYVAIAWVAVVLGFGPRLYGHLNGAKSWPPLVTYVHAAVMTAWLAVFTAQAALIRAERRSLHRVLGTYGAGLAVLVVALGLATALTMSRIEAQQGVPRALPFLFQELMDSATFSVLTGLALWRRRSPEVHRRLITLSLFYVLTPAFARWLGRYTDAVLGGESYFGLIAHLFLWPDVLMASAMVYELATRGRIHLVYRIAVPLLLANEFLVSVVYHTPGWRPIAHFILFGA